VLPIPVHRKIFAATIDSVQADVNPHTSSRNILYQLSY